MGCARNGIIAWTNRIISCQLRIIEDKKVIIAFAQPMLLFDRKTAPYGQLVSQFTFYRLWNICKGSLIDTNGAP